MPRQTQDPPEATPIVADGFCFMKCHTKLAALALAQGKPLWCHRPKIHAFHHFVVEMKQACDMGTRPESSSVFVFTGRRFYRSHGTYFQAGCCQHCSGRGIAKMACWSDAAVASRLSPGPLLSRRARSGCG